MQNNQRETQNYHSNNRHVQNDHKKTKIFDKNIWATTTTKRRLSRSQQVLTASVLVQFPPLRTFYQQNLWFQSILFFATGEIKIKNLLECHWAGTRMFDNDGNWKSSVAGKYEVWGESHKTCWPINQISHEVFSNGKENERYSGNTPMWRLVSGGFWNASRQTPGSVWLFRAVSENYSLAKFI